MQSVRPSASTLVTSAALCTLAMLGSSKRLINYFPGTTQRSLLLSAALGIVAKLVSERISSSNPTAKKCLTAARIAVCTVLAPQLGLSLRASFFLFALSEAFAQFITAVAFSPKASSLMDKKYEPIIQAITELLPTINDFKDQRKWILWLVKTQAQDDIETARALAWCIRDQDTQSEALFEIAKVAISKSDIKKAKEIAESIISACGHRGESWKDNAYIEILTFEAKENLQTAQQTYDTIKSNLDNREHVALALTRAQTFASKSVNPLLSHVASACLTDASCDAPYRPLFVACIKTAAEIDLQATKDFTSSMRNEFLKGIAWIEIAKLEQNNPENLANAQQATKNTVDGPHMAQGLGIQLFTAYIQAVAHNDLLRAKTFAHSIASQSCEEGSYGSWSWWQGQSFHNSADELASKALIETVKIETQTDPAEALKTALRILSPLHQALALIAIAKQLTKQPHADLTLHDVFTMAYTQIRTLGAAVQYRDNDKYLMHKNQAFIKALKGELSCGRQQPTMANLLENIDASYHPRASIEIIKAFAKSGDIEQARQKALEIQEPLLKLRALISILKAIHNPKPNEQ